MQTKKTHIAWRLEKGEDDSIFCGQPRTRNLPTTSAHCDIRLIKTIGEEVLRSLDTSPICKSCQRSYNKIPQSVIDGIPAFE